MELLAVYVGDSANFHIFQFVADEAVGTLYFKKSDSDIPEGVDVNVITPQRDKDLWRHSVNALLEKSREGSKGEAKLIRVLKKYE